MSPMPETSVRGETTPPPALRAPTGSRLWYWVPAIAWVGMVLLASTDPFSAKHTGPILRAVLTWIFGSVAPSTFSLVHLLVRKSGHLTEYGILSALWFRAVRVRLTSPWRMRWALTAVAISLSVAILDEWHQSFVPSRGSSVHDVLLDLTAAILAQFLIWYILRHRKLAAAET
jgi:VanZ family protein